MAHQHIIGFSYLGLFSAIIVNQYHCFSLNTDFQKIQWPFAYLWGIWNPHFGEGEVVVGQRWHHSK